MNKALRVAIIGSGRVAGVRLRELRSLSDVRPVVVAGTDQERVESLARPYGAIPTLDPLAAVRRDDIDAVMICNSNPLHAPLAWAALEAGKHVSVDYPLALTLQQADHLIAEAGRRRLVLHIEHIDLLSYWFLTVRESLPEIGQLLALRWDDCSSRQPGQGRDWVFDRESGGTFFVHEAVPSRLIRLAGPVRSVTTHETLGGLRPGGRFRWRLTHSQWVFENGATAQIRDGIGLTAQGPSALLEVIGTEGRILVENRGKVRLQTSTRDVEIEPSADGGLFRQDLLSFLMQIRGETEPYCPLSHEREVLRVAELIANTTERVS